MNLKGAKMGRNKWLAVIMGLAMPGLGQIYNGELVKGLSYYIILLSLAVVGFRWTVLLPDKWLIIGILLTVAATIVIGVAAIVGGYKKAKTLEATYQPASYNRWYFYLAVWLLGFLLIHGAVSAYITDNILEAYRIPTSSMEPGVRRGDFILADKTAYRRMAPARGDIVVFINPDNRSLRFIKRVEALPGDTVTLADGSYQIVPHGSVYVLGDNRENSQDSRNFGFVPLANVIAKARQVYYSSGKEGIRWGRIGAALGDQHR
jgi:signal peptidase I